ncbi:MAG: Fic family protein [Patiriisocius sp.]|jgi:Fic family protein
MIQFERKKVNNKPYFYLAEQVKIGEKTKKIQVFVGKIIPKDLRGYFMSLRDKETELTNTVIVKSGLTAKYLKNYSLSKIETARIQWKYNKSQLTDAQLSRLIRDLAIRFIFESNAIEGSRLAESEVAAIVQRKYVKKTLPASEVIEVENSIRCFDVINTSGFTLNHKNIIALHEQLVLGLGIPTGFKKQQIVVNNKNTTDPKKVRKELTELISWYKKEKKNMHPFERAVIFHNRFERIHPFTDGNGRVGRLLLNWMLKESGYGYILIKNSNRTAYTNALNKGDIGTYRNMLLLCAKAYKETIDDLVP